MLRILTLLLAAGMIIPCLATTAHAEENPGQRAAAEIREIDAAMKRLKREAEELAERGNREALGSVKEQLARLAAEREKLTRKARGDDWKNWVEEAERKVHALREAGKKEEAEALMRMIREKLNHRREEHAHEHEQHAHEHDEHAHDHEHAHEHEHANHDHRAAEIMERVRHMHKAAENLTAAGLQAEASQLHRKAEQLQQSIHDPNAALRAELNELRQHVQRLTRHVEELTEMVQELRRRK